MASKFAYLKGAKNIYYTDGLLTVEAGSMVWVKKEGNWFLRRRVIGKEYELTPISVAVMVELERSVAELRSVPNLTPNSVAPAHTVKYTYTITNA